MGVDSARQTCNLVFPVQCSYGASSILQGTKRCSSSVVLRSQGYADFEFTEPMCVTSVQFLVGGARTLVCRTMVEVLESENLSCRASLLRFINSVIFLLCQWNKLTGGCSNYSGKCTALFSCLHKNETDSWEYAWNIKNDYKM